jgi:hypothetical protein
VPSQGQLQTRRSVDADNYSMDKQHKVKDKLQAIVIIIVIIIITITIIIIPLTQIGFIMKK